MTIAQWRWPIMMPAALLIMMSGAFPLHADQTVTISGPKAQSANLDATGQLTVIIKIRNVT